MTDPLVRESTPLTEHAPPKPFGDVPAMGHAIVTGDLPHEGCDVCDANAERDQLRMALTDAIDLAARTGNLSQSRAWAKLLSREALEGPE